MYIKILNFIYTYYILYMYIYVNIHINENINISTCIFINIYIQYSHKNLQNENRFLLNRDNTTYFRCEKKKNLFL